MVGLKEDEPSSPGIQ
jgi:hypothetical protein